MIQLLDLHFLGVLLKSDQQVAQEREARQQMQQQMAEQQEALQTAEAAGKAAPALKALQ